MCLSKIQNFVQTIFHNLWKVNKIVVAGKVVKVGEFQKIWSRRCNNYA